MANFEATEISLNMSLASIEAGALPRGTGARGDLQPRTCGKTYAMSVEEPRAQRLTNRFDRMEWAGAFGDLGTLVPFVVAYIAVLGVDPFGVLLAFGVSLVACGFYYKTPFPVQPMKAIGADSHDSSGANGHDNRRRGPCGIADYGLDMVGAGAHGPDQEGHGSGEPALLPWA